MLTLTVTIHAAAQPVPPQALRHQRLRSPERSVRRTWARWDGVLWAWAWWGLDRWGLDRAGWAAAWIVSVSGCAAAAWIEGLTASAAAAWLVNARAGVVQEDRETQRGFSATLTDSPLPTGVVSKGEPALPLSGKSPRRKLLVVAFHSPVQ